MAQMQTSPQLLGVRDTLKNRFGVADERMGWDGEYVTIDGKRAIKPAKNENGTTFASEADFNSASGSIGALNTQHQLMQQVLGGAGVAGQNAATVNPVDQEFTELLSMLRGRVQGQAPITMNDVYASPQYAAQQAQIARQSQQGIRAAQESLGDAGFGRSTRLMDRTQSIQNEASNYLNTQVVPVIMQGLQAERDQQTDALFDLLGVLGQERQLYDSREDSRFNRAMELLGFQTTQSNRAEDVAYRDRRDQVEDQRYQDEVGYRDRRDEVEDQRYADEIAYQRARDAIADERWKLEFDEDVRRFGLNYAMEQAVRQDRLSADAADRALRSRSLDLEERALDLREAEQGGSGGEVDLLSPGELNSYISMIENSKALNTPEKRAAYIESLPISQEDMLRMFSVLGIPVYGPPAPARRSTNATAAPVMTDEELAQYLK